MCPAPPDKNPDQTVDSSHISEIGIFQKKPKKPAELQLFMTKCSERSSTGLSQTSSRFFLWVVVVQDSVAQINIISFSASTLNFALMNLVKE